MAGADEADAEWMPSETQDVFDECPETLQVVTSSPDGTVRLVDARTGRFKVVCRHGGRVWSVAVNPVQPDQVCFSSDQPDVSIYSLRTCTAIGKLVGHKEKVYHCAYSSCGRYITTSSCDCTAKVWDAESMVCLATLEGSTSRLWGTSFSPDGSVVGTACSDHVARVYHIEETIRAWEDSGKAEGASVVLMAALEFRQHSETIYSVDFSPTHPYACSAGDDRVVCVWDRNTGESIHKLKEHSSYVIGCKFDPTGCFIASSSYDHLVLVWDVASGARVHRLEAPTGLYRMSWSADGCFVAGACEDAHLRVWTVESGELLACHGAGHTRRLWSTEIVPEGTLPPK
eukprot:m.151720 g.151720  ORF g.151720 m.151720 type:complete len:343 (-) comp17419_c0_seq1:2205-3233(-)